MGRFLSSAMELAHKIYSRYSVLLIISRVIPGAGHRANFRPAAPAEPKYMCIYLHLNLIKASAAWLLGAAAAAAFNPDLWWCSLSPNLFVLFRGILVRCCC